MKYKKAKINILEVVPYFYPAWAYGGPGKIVYDPSRYFASSENNVTIYTSDAYDEKQRMPKEKRITGVANFQVRYFRNFHNALTYRYNIFITPGLFIKSVFEINKFDVIHMHDFYTLENVWIGWLARLFHKPYFISVHGCLEEKRLEARSFFKTAFLTLFGKGLLNNATALIATSVNEIPAYRRFGVPKSKIRLIGHGVDEKEFTSNLSKDVCRKRFKLSNSDVVVTFLGRIHKIKGLDLLVEAATKIKDSKVHFVIAGPDDGYLGELKKLVAKNKLHKKITLWHGCFGEERAQLFKASDIFVYPSYSEGFSLGILEAASAGLPLVITTKCYFDQVEEYQAGVIVEPDSVSIAKGIMQLTQNSERREKAGKNSKRLIKENYSIQVIGEKLLDVYRKGLAFR